MKLSILAIIFSFFVVVGCSPKHQVWLSTSFNEPSTAGLKYIYSLDGIRWDSVKGVWMHPEVGSQSILRDPSIIRSSDGVFHLVWTTAWKGDKGFGYASSRDLVHWSAQRQIAVMEHEPTTVNVWAPELFYDRHSKEFMVVWASCIPARFDCGQEDSLNNHRLYYTTTKDFDSFTPAKLLCDPGFSSIDATIVERGADDYVLVYKDNTRAERNLRVAFAASPLGPYRFTSESFTDNFVEGPTVCRVGKEYIIYYDAYRNYKFGAAKTSDFINFEDITRQVSLPQGHKHGTMINIERKVLKGLLKAAKQR